MNVDEILSVVVRSFIEILIEWVVRSDTFFLCSTTKSSTSIHFIWCSIISRRRLHKSRVVFLLEEGNSGDRFHISSSKKRSGAGV